MYILKVILKSYIYMQKSYTSMYKFIYCLEDMAKVKQILHN